MAQNRELTPHKVTAEFDEYAKSISIAEKKRAPPLGNLLRYPVAQLCLAPLPSGQMRFAPLLGTAHLEGEQSRRCALRAPQLFVAAEDTIEAGPTCDPVTVSLGA